MVAAVWAILERLTQPSMQRSAEEWRVEVGDVPTGNFCEGDDRDVSAGFEVSRAKVGHDSSAPSRPL